MCRPCLDREKERYAQNSALAHISRVKNYGKSSTTTLKEHLTTEHKISDDDQQPGPSNATAKLVQSKLVLRKKLEHFVYAKCSVKGYECIACHAKSKT